MAWTSSLAGPDWQACKQPRQDPFKCPPLL